MARRLQREFGMSEKEWERTERMLDAPPSVTQVGHLWRAEKAGIVGVGATEAEAIADLSEKFAVSFVNPPEGER